MRSISICLSFSASLSSRSWTSVLQATTQTTICYHGNKQIIKTHKRKRNHYHKAKQHFFLTKRAHTLVLPKGFKARSIIKSKTQTQGSTSSHMLQHSLGIRGRQEFRLRPDGGHNVQQLDMKNPVALTSRSSHDIRLFNLSISYLKMLPKTLGLHSLERSYFT